MDSALVLSAIPLVLFVVTGVLVLYLKINLHRRDLEIKKEREATVRRLYEISILKELGERAGYSLNVEEILSIITGSLRQFIDYTAVAYVVLKPERLKMNIHLERSVDHSFVKEMKERMLASLEALSGKMFPAENVDQVVSGAIAINSEPTNIGSYFNIPLVIAGELEGVLTIAHLNKGLYKEEDMTILYKITSQASSAVARLQEVVKIEKGKLNAMVESMGDGVVMVDQDYEVIVANPAVRKIANISKNEAITIFDFIDSLGGKFDIRGKLEEAMVRNSSYLSERVQISDSFYEIGVYPVSHTLISGNNQKLGAVVAFHDITRDIELERVREEYTSMIVHELRSPLDGMRKIVELIISGHVKARSREYREYLSLIHQSSSSMLELVNDVLDLAKLQAGKFEIIKEKTNISEIIENRSMFYKVSANAKKVSLSSWVTEMPESIELDPRALKQVINNFLSNSLKFTPSGGNITISAFVSYGKKFDPVILQKVEESKIPVFPSVKDLSIKKPSLCVVVSDTGIGISDSAISGLFHTFKQLRIGSGDGEEKGTGLGLAIAKGIIEAHEGNIGVVSTEGRGSSFFFTIPL